MKIRALGTGSTYSRHPLAPPCFLVYTDGAVVAIGAPFQLSTRLAALGDENNLSMVVLLSSTFDQMAGLYELANLPRKSRIVIATTAAIMQDVKSKLAGFLPPGTLSFFEYKCVTKVSFEEEHFSETMSLVPNYGPDHSCAIRFENAKVMITGAAPLNEDWLHHHIDCDLILHQIDERGITPSPTIESLQKIPLYMQNRIWVYGYDDISKEAQPFPMMYVTPLAWVFNSWRKQKIMSKERVIKENATKQLG